MPTVPGNRKAATTMPGTVVTSMKWSQAQGVRLNEESSNWRRRCRLDVAARVKVVVASFMRPVAA